MLNYLIIVAISLVLMALKLTKFIAVAIVLALIVLFILRNGSKAAGPLRHFDKKRSRK